MSLLRRDEISKKVRSSDRPEKSRKEEHLYSRDTQTHTLGTMDPQHGRVERFLKLGYSHSDIIRVLENLHHEAQTNDILEELIKTCRTSSSSTTNNSSTCLANPHSPQLVPRGCSPPKTCSSPSPPLRPSNAPEREASGGFRPIVIDGSNVAISHGNKKVFSCRGLELAVLWFWEKGIRDITVFVPLWRKEQPRPEAPITDQHILHELEKRKILVYTPSRCVNGKRVVCYDDRYIINLAYDSDGIIVSNDNYRDLQSEKPQWKKFIEKRLLMYSFVNDKFMPPDDPLGRNGPTIDNFLRKQPWTLENKQQHCPYGKKCTYGVKCKFYHPERSNQSQLSVADELRAKSKPAVEREQAYVPQVTALNKQTGQDTHMYTTPYHEPGHTTHLYRYPSTPPPPRIEDHPHRCSPCELFTQQRDSGSPALLRPPSLRLCPSPDTDEAFGSLESSLSRLYFQDSASSHPKGVSYTYSSGVAGCSQGSGDFYPSSLYSNHSSSSGSDKARRLGIRGPPSLGGYPSPGRQPHCGCDRTHGCEVPACCQSIYNQQMHLRPPSLPSMRGSYPGPFHSDDNVPLPYYSPRHTHSLPEYPWGQGTSDVGAVSRNDCSSGEERRSVSIQLSTLFPQNVVEQVMSRHPHILDMSELIPLIHSFRAGHFSF